MRRTKRIGRLTLCAALWLSFLNTGCTRASGGGEERPPPSADYLPPAPSVTGPRIAETHVPTAPPFVGAEGVDSFGYPRRQPDKVALLNLLRLGRFDLLEQAFTFYQDQFEADVRSERWPIVAASAFQSTEPALREKLDEWVQKSLGSFSPWVARAYYRYGLAWHARGIRLAKDTSPAQFAAMNAEFVEAERDVRRALELRPRLQAAHSLLLRNASTQGAEPLAVRALLSEALKQCPTCYSVRAAYMGTLEPRWGGSFDAMERFISETEPRMKENRKLELLRGAIANERCRVLVAREETAAGHAACDSALLHGEEPYALARKTWLFLQEKRIQDALGTAERALQVDPQHSEALGLRQSLRVDTGDYLGAARDLIVLRHVDSTNANLAQRTTWLVQKLKYEGHLRSQAGKNTEAGPYFALGLQLAPDDRDLMHRQGWAAKDQVEQLRTETAQRPGDFELHLKLDHALAMRRRFAEVVQMWDTFILAHPQDPRAYFERGGAKWHLRQRALAMTDLQHACDLGMSKACADLARMKSGR